MKRAPRVDDVVRVISHFRHGGRDLHGMGAVVERVDVAHGVYLRMSRNDAPVRFDCTEVVVMYRPSGGWL